MKKNVLGIGVIIVIAAVAYFLGNGVVELPDLAFFKYLGAFITILGELYLVGETVSNQSFFYGKSQSGGSNANSYVVIAIGMVLACWHFSLGQYIIAMVGCILLTLLVYAAASSYVQKKAV